MILFKRDENAKTVEIGLIEYNGDWKFGFDGYDNLKDWLRKGAMFGGVLLEGRKLFDRLPYVLRGDRLWVAI